MVFRTSHGGEETLWACADFDAGRHRVRYCRLTPGSRVGFVTVACRALGHLCTEVEVGYALTALSPQGEAVLAAMTGTAYERMLADWQARTTRLLSAAAKRCPAA